MVNDAYTIVWDHCSPSAIAVSYDAKTITINTGYAIDIVLHGDVLELKRVVWNMVAEMERLN